MMNGPQIMSVQTPPSSVTRQEDAQEVSHKRPAETLTCKGTSSLLPQHKLKTRCLYSLTNTAGGRASAFSGSGISHGLSPASASVSRRGLRPDTLTQTLTTQRSSDQRTAAEASGSGVHSGAAAAAIRRCSLPRQMPPALPLAAAQLLPQLRRLEPRPANGPTLPRSGAVIIHSSSRPANGPTLPPNRAVIIHPPSRQLASLPSLIAAAGKCTCSFRLHQHIHAREKRYLCKQCNKRFIHSGDLKIHQRIHTGEKPYLCKHCGKRFNVSGALKRHQHIHTGEKPYHCKQCDKSFNDMSNLKKHQHIHTGEKPYHCKQCDKSFSQLAHLKLHQRVHTGEKPYHCKECDKSFIHSGDLKIHQRIHTGEKPYHCEQCSKSFRQLGNLKSHRRHIHIHELTKTV